MSYSLREALNAFRRAPLLAALSATMIALSLFVVGLFGLAAYNIKLVISRMEERVEVVAYLRDGAERADVNNAIREMKKWSEVRDVIYVSREQALAKAREEMKEFDDIFSGLESNPLPASLEVVLNPNLKGADVVRNVANRAKLFPFVEEVGFGNDWLDKVFLLRRVAAVATLVLGSAFAVVAALIIGAAIRLAIFSRRDEISIMQLVGATDAFIRRPFLIEGMITGLAGGVIALIGTYTAYNLLGTSLFALEWLPRLWTIGGVVAGGILGTAASSIAVRRHLGEV
ncbi:MAG: permease-like cell division protein FtsX [Longimicrobiales bacterium]